MAPKKKLKDLLGILGVDEEKPGSQGAFMVAEALKDLEGYQESIREYKNPPFVFDPSDPAVVSYVIATAMFAMPRRPLTSLPAVLGSGIYALFYTGTFSAYGKIKGKDTPIYIGSAGPKNRRAPNPEGQGTALHTRLSEHAKSVRAVEAHHGGDEKNLRVSDFEYRYLVIKSGWEKSAEDFLIHFFKPVWNSESKVCFGIGKHGDSTGTRGNTRSPWDTLHPGRKWALDAKLGKAAKEIEKDVRIHLDEFGGRKLDGAALLALLKGDGADAGNADQDKAE